jgi:hypothetical protein
MSKQEIKDGGPAFPVEVQNRGDGTLGGLQTSAVSGWEIGMSLRDYFAAKAMQGIFSNPKLCDVSERQDVTVWVSRRAYQVADAMLAAREPQ